MGTDKIHKNIKTKITNSKIYMTITLKITLKITLLLKNLWKLHWECCFERIFFFFIFQLKTINLHFPLLAN